MTAPFDGNRGFVQDMLGFLPADKNSIEDISYSYYVLLCRDLFELKSTNALITPQVLNSANHTSKGKSATVVDKSSALARKRVLDKSMEAEEAMSTPMTSSSSIRATDEMSSNNRSMSIDSNRGSFDKRLGNISKIDKNNTNYAFTNSSGSSSGSSSNSSNNTTTMGKGQTSTKTATTQFTNDKTQVKKQRTLTKPPKSVGAYILI